MISSKENDLIKLCVKIKDKKYSRAEKLALVETIKLVSGLYLKGRLTHILVTEDKYDLVRGYKKCEIVTISKAVANYLSDAKTTDGVFGICKITSNIQEDYSRCLVLDRIQDPSNLGAFIRSAYAFGFKTIFAINSVYPYSFKSIRASMGYIFDINYIETSVEDLNDLKQKHNLSLVVADMSGQILDDYSPKSENLALVIGNEGGGVDKRISIMADDVVRIPMYNDVESLNASVSAGIIMYNLRK